MDVKLEMGYWLGHCAAGARRGRPRRRNRSRAAMCTVRTLALEPVQLAACRRHKISPPNSWGAICQRAGSAICLLRRGCIVGAPTGCAAGSTGASGCCVTAQSPASHSIWGSRARRPMFDANWPLDGAAAQLNMGPCRAGCQPHAVGASEIGTKVCA